MEFGIWCVVQNGCVTLCVLCLYVVLPRTNVFIPLKRSSDAKVANK